MFRQCHADAISAAEGHAFGALLSSDTCQRPPIPASFALPRQWRHRARTLADRDRAVPDKLEDIGQPDHGFSCSQHEEAVRSVVCETAEDVDLGV